MTTLVAFRRESGMGWVTSYPNHWERGTLLDHMLFANGKSRCILLGESPEAEGVSFNSREDAQCFISWWYAPASAKMMERECQDTPAYPPKTVIT